MYFKVKINTYPPYVVMLVKMPTKICLFRRQSGWKVSSISPFNKRHHFTKTTRQQNISGEFHTLKEPLTPPCPNDFSRANTASTATESVQYGLTFSTYNLLQDLIQCSGNLKIKYTQESSHQILVISIFFPCCFQNFLSVL